MTPITISLIVFACLAGGLAVGMVLRAFVPEEDLGSDSTEVIKLGLGLTTTMTALILGLLISTAKTSYDGRRNQVTEIAADAILLDRTLDLYGSDASALRVAVRNLIADLVNQIEAVRGVRKLNQSEMQTEDFYHMLRRLVPRDDEQKSLKAEIVRASFEIGQVRALTLAQESTSVPFPFLLVLVFWLLILFTGYGLFTPFKPMTISALIVCAVSVSTALLMILAMDEPLTGIMQISIEPLKKAISVIGK